MNICLTWQDDLRFEGRLGEARTAIDGNAASGVSPVGMLLEALAACAASDVVEILRKGRQRLEGLEVRARGLRRETPPRFFTRVELEFRLKGPIPLGKAERAVRLSFERYCSVFHSLRPDLELDYAVRVEA
ncbi:MAG: OsmC family protein [Gemmatimonadota bacterium]